MKASTYPEPLCADAAAAEPAGAPIGSRKIPTRIKHGLGHAHDDKLRDTVPPLDLERLARV